MNNLPVARVNIVVEGHTEEEFVGAILAPHLAQFQVYPTACRVLTSQHGPLAHRGGMTNYARAKNDVVRWLKQDRRAYVTTFFDLYALPTDFPDYAQAARATSGAARAARLETAFRNDVNFPLFLPYIQPHEFEALLFSDVQAIDSAMQLVAPASMLHRLQPMLTGYQTPEDLNDSPVTAPSKRLLSLYPAYDKRLFGPPIAGEIGLLRMRQACPHFDGWLSRLESLPPI